MQALYTYLSSRYILCRYYLSSGSAQPQLPIRNLVSIKIPLPPLEEQKQIVTQVEREQSLVNANKELIAIYDQKIKDEINKLWEQ
jgi:type I restriction enzyme M protein